MNKIVVTTILTTITATSGIVLWFKFFDPEYLPITCCLCSNLFQDIPHESISAVLSEGVGKRRVGVLMFGVPPVLHLTVLDFTVAATDIELAVLFVSSAVDIVHDTIISRRFAMGKVKKRPPEGSL